MNKEIIVDGYNFIHKIVKYKKLLKKNLEYTRRILEDDLKHYSDQSGNSIALVFDGKINTSFGNKAHSKGVKVIFSDNSADCKIERLAYKAADKHNILVVTDDNMTKNLVFGMGVFHISCHNFYSLMKLAEDDLIDSLVKRSSGSLKHRIKL